jgi:selenocysteine lyase/cysteine desulfurase
MTSSAIRRDWKTEFEISPGTVFLNHASFGPVTRRGRLAAESLMERWGRLTPGPDVDDETFAMLASSKGRFARLIGASAAQVAFAPNTSYGLNAVLWGLNLRKGERILMPEVEFPALVYAVKNIAQRLDLTIEPLPCPRGYLELDILEKALARRSAVLALSWVQYFNGYRYDLEEIASLCHASSCFVLVDAIQGVGAVPLDVEQARIDALACGAQKWLLGQTGSGFFYIARSPVREVQPLEAGWLGVDWGYRFHDLKDWNKPAFEDGRRWEIGTYPFFSIRFAEAGLAILEECGREAAWEYIQGSLSHLLEDLQGSGYQPALLPDARHRSGILSLKGPRTREMHEHLHLCNVHTSFREGTIRVSPHLYNTEDDIAALVEAMRRFEAGG